MCHTTSQFLLNMFILFLKEDLIWRHKGKVHISNLIVQTTDAAQKLQILDKTWPVILYEIVRNTFKDYSDINVYMKLRCNILKEEKSSF